VADRRASLPSIVQRRRRARAKTESDQRPRVRQSARSPSRSQLPLRRGLRGCRASALACHNERRSERTSATAGDADRPSPRGRPRANLPRPRNSPGTRTLRIKTASGRWTALVVDRDRTEARRYNTRDERRVVSARDRGCDSDEACQRRRRRRGRCRRGGCRSCDRDRCGEQGDEYAFHFPLCVRGSMAALGLYRVAMLFSIGSRNSLNRYSWFRVNDRSGSSSRARGRLAGGRSRS
jgi:hypothetical protein